MFQVIICFAIGAAVLEAQAPALVRMDTVAGRLEPVSPGEQKQSEVLLYDPVKAIPDGSGGFYVVERFHYRVRRLLADGTVRTVLGTGLPGSPVDGAKGETLQITNPWDAALDSSGNLFVVSEVDCTVVRLTPEGVVRIVAGSGVCGYSGDNDDAAKASLSAPVAVAVDAAGRVYISDRNNHRIRRVDADGKIRTIAGTGQNLATAANSTDPLATHVPSPRGLAIDKAGNLYYTDGSRRVRRMAATGAITTVAGSGAIGFSGNGGPAASASFRAPEWLALDEERSLLYVSDRVANQVRVIDLRSGTISHFAGILPSSPLLPSAADSFSGDGAQANNAGLASPAGLAVDTDGSVLIADQRNDRIRRVSRAGVIRTLLGRFRNQTENSDAKTVEFRSIIDVASTPAGLLVLDSGTDVVGRIDNSGKFQIIAGIPPDKLTGRERSPDFQLRFESAATSIRLGDTLAMEVDGCCV